MCLMFSQGCLGVKYCYLKAPAGELVGNRDPLVEKLLLFLLLPEQHEFIAFYQSIASARTQRSLCPNLRVELQQFISSAHYNTEVSNFWHLLLMKIVTKTHQVKGDFDLCMFLIA